MKNLFFIVLLGFSSAGYMLDNSAWGNEASSSAAPEIRYVQSKIAQVYAAPAFNANKLSALSYGSQVELLGEEKSWAKIRIAEGSGWVAKMVLATAKPLAKTTLSSDAPSNTHGKARKRASVRASAAATRGLADNFRQRKEEQQQHDSNYQALQKVEEFKVEETDVLEFNQALKQ